MMKKILFSAVLAVSLAVLPSCKKAVSPASAQNKTGTMNITSDPSGAEISIYGGVVGKTPYTTQPVPEATYIVKVAKDGCKSAWMPVKVVAGQQAEAHFKLEPETGTVIIDSVPSGAHLKFNGKDYDTPASLTEIPLGNHECSLSLDGYIPRPIPLNVPNARPIRMEVPMKRNIGSLSLASNLDDDQGGVNIEIDGKPSGSTTTASKIDLIPGQYTVRFTKDGFKPFEKDVLVELDKTTSEYAEMEPLPGTLAIDSDPSGASITVSGPSYRTPYKGETPFRRESLEAGKYTVRLERTGYDPAEETVIVEKGGTEERLIRLFPNTCVLVLNVNPPGMNVYLDGKFVTTTVKDPEHGSRDISESVRMEKLSAGEHTITVSNKYAKPNSVSKTITVRKGETVQEKIDDFWLPDTEIVLKVGSKYRGRLSDRYSEDSDKVPFHPAKGITNEYNRSEIQSITPLNIIDDKK